MLQAVTGNVHDVVTLWIKQKFFGFLQQILNTAKIRNQEAIAFSDIKVGDTIKVTLDADGNATAVVVMNAGAPEAKEDAAPADDKKDDASKDDSEAAETTDDSADAE